jgi:hypothetical protein
MIGKIAMRLKRKLSTLTHIFIFSLVIIVQKSAAETGFWFSGSGGLSSYSGFSGTASLSGGFQLKRLVGQVYISKTNESDFLDYFTLKKPMSNYSDYGLLGGVSIIKNDWVHLCGTAGISHIQGKRRGELIAADTGFVLVEERYQSKTFKTLNLPLDVNISFIKLTYFGFGANFHANLNKEFQDFALSFALFFGKLR